MRRYRLLLLAFALIFIMGLLHIVGSFFYWYWNSFWFDALMHLLGGASVALFGIWVWYVSGLFEVSIPTKRSAMIAALVFALGIGIAWEFFEFVYGIANPVGGNYPVDTFHDVAFDFVGGVAAGIIVRIKSLYA